MSDVTITSQTGGSPPGTTLQTTPTSFLGPLSGLAGAGISSAAGLLESLNLQRFNRREAQKNRDWQERMSGTAHQREVADLEKAGLNPILSAGGAGSAVTSGSTASAPSSTPATQAALAGLGAMSQTALNVAQSRLANSAAALNDQQVRKTDLDNIFNEYSMNDRLDLIGKQLGLTDEQTNELKARVKLHGASTTHVGAQGRLQGQEADFMEQLGKSGNAGKYIIQLLNLLKP